MAHDTPPRPMTAAPADAALAAALAAAARDGAYPDGRPGRFLDAPVVAELAARFVLAPRLVEIAALDAGLCPLRYARNQIGRAHV